MCNPYETMQVAVARGLESQVSVAVTAHRTSQTAVGYHAQGSSVTYPEHAATILLLHRNAHFRM